MAVAAFVATVASTAVSVKQQKKAQRAQEKASKIDQKRQEFTMAREKRKQIRAAREAQASIQATSFAQGTSQTSRTAGISGNISSEMSQNLSFLDTSQSFTKAIGKQNLVSSRAMARASQAQAIGKVASAGANAFAPSPTGVDTGTQTNLFDE